MNANMFEGWGEDELDMMEVVLSHFSSTGGSEVLEREGFSDGDLADLKQVFMLAKVAKKHNISIEELKRRYGITK